jgi:hypothetical protein
MRRAGPACRSSTILATLGGAAGLLFAFCFNGVLTGIQQQTAFVPRTVDGSLDAWRARS